MNDDTPPNFSPFNKRDMMITLGIVSPVLFILFVSFHMRAFVIHAVEANLAINLGIITAASAGVFLILRRLFDAQEDFRILERFGYEARQGVYMKSLLEESWLNRRYVRHYLYRIASTGGTLASQMEQNAIESELHALQSDYESRLELPQFLVGFMIAMGLLGTFIGLLETLTGISGMLDGMGGTDSSVEDQFLKLVVELRKPLAGMGIAFSASMFGLVTSLMLSIMMTNLRRYVSRVVSLARNVMFELTEIAHGVDKPKTGSGVAVSVSPSEIDALLADPNNQIEPQVPAASSGQQAIEDPVVHGHLMAPEDFIGIGGGGIDPALSGRFSVLTKKIEILLGAIETNTETTRKLNDLIGYGPRMRELSEKTLDEIRALGAISADQQMLLQSMVSGNSEIVRTLAMYVDTQKLSNTEAVEQIRKLLGMQKDVREATIGNGRHLNDIKENFTKLSKNSDMIEMIASSLGGVTALLEVVMQESRRSNQALVNINQSVLSRNSGA